jgi:hypothetical protein
MIETMNRFLPLLCLAFLLVGCGDRPATDELELADDTLGEEVEAVVEIDGDEYVSYGDPLPVDPDGIVALDAAVLAEDLGTYENTVVRVEGTVAKVCQMKGCWLTFQTPASAPVRVQVPRDDEGEYVYTFPMDLGAAEVIVEGTVTSDSTDVETLRHFAEDEGLPQEEIDAITEPERTIILTARGALVKRGALAETVTPQS